jgi:hypothetical protein
VGGGATRGRLTDTLDRIDELLRARVDVDLRTGAGIRRAHSTEYCTDLVE